jgi:hypothetical protein
VTGRLAGFDVGDTGLTEIDGLDRREFDRRTSSKGRLVNVVESGELLDDEVSAAEEQSRGSRSAIVLLFVIVVSWYRIRYDNVEAKTR